jgi:hypothetical protein
MREHKLYDGTNYAVNMDDLGFKSWQGLGIFLFTTVSRPTLGPTQPPIQWVPGALSLGVKWLGCEANHSPPSSAEVKECVGLHLYPPPPHMPSQYGAQLKAQDKFTFTFMVCVCVSYMYACILQ